MEKNHHVTCPTGRDIKAAVVRRICERRDSL